MTGGLQIGLALSAPAHSSRRRFRPSPPPFNPSRPTTPPAPPSPPGHWVPTSNPASASKRRQKPLGVYLGTWKQSGPTASGRNAVYGSRDRKNRINRWISKEDDQGNVIRGGNFDTKKNACKPENIDYIERYRGMTRKQVGAAIKPLIDAPPPPPQFGYRRTAGATSSPPTNAAASSALPVDGGGLSPIGSAISMITDDERAGRNFFSMRGIWGERKIAISILGTHEPYEVWYGWWIGNVSSYGDLQNFNNGYHWSSESEMGPKKWSKMSRFTYVATRLTNVAQSHGLHQ